MKFTFPSAAALALSYAAPVLAQGGVPDQPISFYARLYHNSSTCNVPAVVGSQTSAYLGSRGSCVNIAVNGQGSAQIIVGEVGRYFLAGWTGRDCTGRVVAVESNVGVCVDLGGTDVLSWSDDLRFGGE